MQETSMQQVGSRANRLLFNPEDGGNMFYMAIYPRTMYSSEKYS
jgi:hypothetical protein